MIKKQLTLTILVSFTFLIISCQSNKKEEIKKEILVKPNIVVIYLDDLGYGDLSSYGATELQTPNIDALASGGIKFTNGYASSATCTPTFLYRGFLFIISPQISRCIVSELSNLLVVT